MLLLLLLIILVFAGILPGLYLALRHILGYQFGLIHRYGASIGIFLLRAALFMFFSQFTLNGWLLSSVVSLLFATLLLVLLKRMKRLQRVKQEIQRLVFGGMLAGGIVLSVTLIGFWVIDPVEIKWLLVGGLAGFFGGGIIGGLVTVVALFIQFFWMHFSRFAFQLLAPLFILPRFATIICNQCYRVTFPLKCRYDLGRRACEHCQKTVEDTKDFGKVVFTFGDVPFTPQGRVFVLANPDFEHQAHHVEVSEIYLDPRTTDQRLLERFITYIINYPPSKGVRSVNIFYQGEFEALGANLKNALQNTFDKIEQMS